MLIAYYTSLALMLNEIDQSKLSAFVACEKF